MPDEKKSATKVGGKDGQDKAAAAREDTVQARTAEEKDRDDERRPNLSDDRDPERPADDVAATYADPETGEAPVVGNRPPDAYHVEPSTYTPAGARPGQQNPVNPQGSPNADPHAREVGARPEQVAPVLDQGFNGDYTKVMTEGEKNPSQLPVDVEREEYRQNAPWMYEDATRERKMREARGK
jgi:hypothetical protein